MWKSTVSDRGGLNGFYLLYNKFYKIILMNTCDTLFHTRAIKRLKQLICYKKSNFVHVKSRFWLILEKFLDLNI